MPTPRLFGILNITEDSFSDGGRYLDSRAAIAHARNLRREGAQVIDIGAAASNVSAQPVTAEEEIRRLSLVLPDLAALGAPVSVDTPHPVTQRFAIARGAAFLNDVTGFPHAAFYPELAAANCRLVVMHAAVASARPPEQERVRAQGLELTADTVWQRVHDFFGERLARLEAAGIARERLIIDPGMGFFLGSQPEPSLRLLAGIARLKRAFALPVLVSVSRKSFLRAVTGRVSAAESGPATLAAELYAAMQGVDYIRTHDPGALRDGLAISKAIQAEAARLPP